MERIESVCPHGHADTRLTAMRQLSAGYVPRFDPAGPLHFDRPAGLAIDVSADKVERITGDLNDAALAGQLHAAFHVDRLAPKVVDEFSAAEDARDHRAEDDADEEGQ